MSKKMEVTVISAEEQLVNKKRPIKNSLSVTVISGNFYSGSTGVNREGRGFPVWNEKLEMALPNDSTFITVEVKSGRTVIGAATIPVTDFAGGRLPEDYLSFISYRLKGAGGEKNGIVHLSVKVKGNGNYITEGGATTSSRPWTGVPSPDANLSANVVMGTPASFTY